MSVEDPEAADEGHHYHQNNVTINQQSLYMQP
jgi:hypothetical protein